ncbi:MAG: YIP1 family protein [Chloroflexi bacterium]|nr:YIP1 family protein [Chloroflexota bacterium]
MQPASASLTDRMLRAARLDVRLYEEVEAEVGATRQALWVVIIAALADGLGTALGGALLGRGAPGIFGGLVVGAAGAVVGWIVWSYLTYWIGTRFFEGRATPGELLRTIGFAQSPRVLNVASFVPLLGGLVQVAVALWLLVAGIVAIRQALDVSTGKAIATAVGGWLAMLVVSAVAIALAGLLGLGARLIG